MLWALLGLCVLAAPWGVEYLRKPVRGGTHHRWYGPSDGPVAVCIHGLTTPSQIYDPLIGHLTSAGYRALVYDLPGRGQSGAIAGVQDGGFFLRQLDALLSDQGIERVDLLIGYSMGGSIATRFAARSPRRVGRMVLLAPAGLLHDPGAMAEFVRRAPLIGDWVMLAFGGVALRRALRAAPDAPVPDVQIAQTRRRGFLPAVLSSQRHMLTEDMRPYHGALRVGGPPTLAIWGIEDDVIPVSNVGRLAEVNRAAHQATIPGASHALPYTHADAVIGEISEFLTETRANP